MIRFKWITLAAYIYLVLPFVIFCLGWIRIPLNLLSAILICFISFQILRQIFKASTNEPGIQLRSFIFPVILLGIWVLFSGIGGFTFQNSDFNARNAIFRDLINEPWPVIYSPSQSNHIFPGHSQIMLVYYFGYWLPAALIGKLAGWGGANAFLYFWSWLGTILVVMLLAKKFHKSPYLPTLFLIFFSGMDILGELLLIGNNRQNLEFPALSYIWPPIQHLEWWAQHMEYSSFTTQIYWVFNQALPAWLCMAIFVNGIDRRHIAFLWALCFFYAPLPAVGMFPFVMIVMFKRDTQKQITDLKKNSFLQRTIGGLNTAWQQTRQVLSFENVLGGGVIILVAYLFFSSNLAIQRSGILNISPIMLLLFDILEFGMVWVILLPLHFKNLRWYLIGILLSFLPLLRVGFGPDISMRASIPALFLLMVAAAEGLYLLKGKKRLLLIICLVIGAATPIYEINRSIARTAAYYFFPNNPKTQELLSYNEPRPIDELTADEIGSISNCRNCVNFVGDGHDSLFYRYLARK